ncbi:MAG: hypothetical protein IPN65_03080 [Elusimicrobia bacterium]|nr:hypothetical protein [Elusimicrobiota bacterium]MBK7207044.1 hypothetical protein [Elusimicrobiota bacterium]MBK7545864.1 hypothetical protein [Elusimicrobiota bacterium]MBK7575128.1 hypothetical protein [Elusimicrobiota bacterium]MBK7687608.1 hypothetical protein [Elusimicrobiota bacterium]
MARRQRFRKKSPLPRFLSARAVVYPALGLLLAVPTVGAWVALARQVRAVAPLWMDALPFLAGAGLYLLLQWVFRRPMTLYVFGHELTHAVAAAFSGYKVKSLFVSDKGGEVRLSGSNVAVALAPYCVPIYAVGVLGLYALVRRYADLAAPPLWVGAGLGFTLAFHAALTVHALRQDQPDLRQAGRFFSLVLIALANALVLALVAKALFPRAVSLAAFRDAWALNTFLLIDRAGDALSGIGRWVAAVLAGRRGP